MAEAAEIALPGVQPVLTMFMHMVWRLRKDLQSRFDLYTPIGQQAFVWWMLTEGVREWPELAACQIAACDMLLVAPAAEALPTVTPTLTCFMKLAWSMRPDLQAAFDLHHPQAQQDFVWWYFTHGPAEFQAVRYFTEAQKRFLNEPDPQLFTGESLPVTRLMTQLVMRKLRETHSLNTPEGRTKFLSWYFTRGVVDLQITDLIDEHLAKVLLTSVPGNLPIPTILAMIWTSDAAIQRLFPDPGSPDFLAWSHSLDGKTAHPILGRLAELAPVPMPAIVQSRDALPFGVNLIGSARGQFGIGEDVRMAALAMNAAGIPFSIYNVEPGREMCQGDHSVDTLIHDTLPYAINMLCLTGMETARLAAEKGTSLFDGRRNIGYWPWELPEWPAEWTHAYDLVDEVWASSRYTYQAYGKSCPKPVRHMPMTVMVELTAGLTRRSFGLPEGRFLFVFSFDVVSSLTRKNPQACVRAFRAAFPKGSEPVGLVLKAMRASTEAPHWQTLLHDAKEDPRIYVLNRTMDRAEVLDLYRSCDCFLSLHRAEGFGRGIAEAMMLGKPVIVTGYSGNMDFTVPGTAGLVDYRLRRLTVGEYPYSEGQVWADPDIDHAAWWMHRIAENRFLRQRLAVQGQILTTVTFAPATAGFDYAAELVAETP